MASVAHSKAGGQPSIDAVVDGAHHSADHVGRTFSTLPVDPTNPGVAFADGEIQDPRGDWQEQLVALLCDSPAAGGSSSSSAVAPTLAETSRRHTCEPVQLVANSVVQFCAEPSSTQILASAEWEWDDGWIPMPGSYCDSSADDPQQVHRPAPVLGPVLRTRSRSPIRFQPDHVDFRFAVKHPRREGLVRRKHSKEIVADLCEKIIQRVTHGGVNFKIGVAQDPVRRLELYKKEGVKTLVALFLADDGAEAAWLERSLIGDFRGGRHCRNVGAGGEGIGAMQGPTWVYVALGGAQLESQEDSIVFWPWPRQRRVPKARLGV